MATTWIMYKIFFIINIIFTYLIPFEQIKFNAILWPGKHKVFLNSKWVLTTATTASEYFRVLAWFCFGHFSKTEEDSL